MSVETDGQTLADAMANIRSVGGNLNIINLIANEGPAYVDALVAAGAVFDSAKASALCADAINRHGDMNWVEEMVAASKGVQDAVDSLTNAPPTVVDVPHLYQEGTLLTCTMGNWNGSPTSYDYQWQVDGVDVSYGSPEYTVQAGDAGKTCVCTVTATNAAGSGSSTSNEVVVT